MSRLIQNQRIAVRRRHKPLSRAVSAARALADIEGSEPDHGSFPSEKAALPAFHGIFIPHSIASAWRILASIAHFVCDAIVRLVQGTRIRPSAAPASPPAALGRTHARKLMPRSTQVHPAPHSAPSRRSSRPPSAHSPATAPPLRITILAATVFLAIVITTSVVAGDIDLTKLMPGAEKNGRPRIVVIDGKLVNHGDAPALNLEITKPRYRLIGNLAPSEGIPIPSGDFAVQYEWRDKEKIQRETRAFKTEQTQVARHRSSAGTITAPYVEDPGQFRNTHLPPNLAASYDPATHLLTVTADRSIEVRVDGFLLRPISRTDKDGAEYRFTQANLLVLGQDLKRGETTVFEVVFTKPQDFYSIPIYVREPGGPANYLTVAVATSPRS